MTRTTTRSVTLSLNPLTHMDFFFKDADSIWQGVVASTLILVALLAVVRVAGLRTFSKMTSIDFAVTVAMGSVLGATAANSVTVTQGFVAIAALVALQALVSSVLRASPAAAKVLMNQPLLVMDGPQVLYDNLKFARMSESQLRGKLREANVLQLSQVRAVVLESTGDVSVLHCEDPETNVEAWLLQGVRRTP